MVYPGRILKLRVRGTKKDLMQDILSEEVCVVIPGVVARFDGIDIQASYIAAICVIVILEHGKNLALSVYLIQKQSIRNMYMLDMFD